MNTLINAHFDAVEVELINSKVVHFYRVIRKEVSLSDGKLRIATSLADGSLLEFFVYVQEVSGRIEQSKYSFHWQNPDGAFIRRWDNAPHHPEIPTFPHHLHAGHEKNVLPHENIGVFEVLGIIEAELSDL